MVIFKKTHALQEIVKQQNDKISDLVLQNQEMGADILTLKAENIPKYRGNNYENKSCTGYGWGWIYRIPSF